MFVDGIPKTKVDANKRSEMRDCMASAGLAPDEINQKVHELYLTNQRSSSAAANFRLVDPDVIGRCSCHGRDHYRREHLLFTACALSFACFWIPLRRTA